MFSYKFRVKLYTVHSQKNNHTNNNHSLIDWKKFYINKSCSNKKMSNEWKWVSHMCVGDCDQIRNTQRVSVDGLLFMVSHTFSLKLCRRTKIARFDLKLWFVFYVGVKTTLFFLNA